MARPGFNLQDTVNTGGGDAGSFYTLDENCVVFTDEYGIPRTDEGFFKVELSSGNQGVLIYGAGMGDTPTTGLGADNRPLRLVNQGQYVVVMLTTWSDTAAHRPILWFERGRGDETTKAAVQNNDNLAQIRASGYYNASSIATGFILSVEAAENWSGSAQGTRAVFSVRRTGTTTLDNILTLENQQVRFDQDGTAAKPAAAFSSETNLGWRRYGAGTQAWVVGGADELILTAAALRPYADGGLSLGADGYCWQDLFLNPRDASPSVEGQLLADNVRRAHESYIGGELGQLHRLNHSQTSDTSKTGTSEQTVSTYTIPAASGAAGKVYKFTASGQCTGQAGANVTIRVKIGGSEIFEDFCEGDGLGWRISGEIVYRTRGASATVAYGVGWVSEGTNVDAESGTYTLNTQSALALIITHQGAHSNHTTTIHTFNVWEA
jgi:hypothetical protein